MANPYIIKAQDGVEISGNTSIIGNTTITGSITAAAGITIPSGYTLIGTASYAQTASYSTTLGASLGQSGGSNTVDLVSSNGTTLSTVTINNVAVAGASTYADEIKINANIPDTLTYPIYVPSNGAYQPVHRNDSFTYDTTTNTLSTTASYAITASYAMNGGGTSINTSSLATTGSNNFNGNQTITGSLTVTQNLIVLGSSSITYISQSTLNISTNLITVNANNPSVRFGGLAVIDSGSSPQRSGSILFDSQNNQWIFVHQNTGGAITSSVFIQGPQTFNNVGNETTLTANRVPKAIGEDLGEHIGDSNITDNGTFVSINSNTQITGSLTVTGGITGSVLSSSYALTSSYALSGGSGGSGDTTAVEAQFWFLI